MVEKDHRRRTGTFVEPGELSAKERSRGERGRPVRTLPLPVIRVARLGGAADAEDARDDDAPRSA